MKKRRKMNNCFKFLFNIIQIAILSYLLLIEVGHSHLFDTVKRVL